MNAVNCVTVNSLFPSNIAVIPVIGGKLVASAILISNLPAVGALNVTGVRTAIFVSSIAKEATITSP